MTRRKVFLAVAALFATFDRRVFAAEAYDGVPPGMVALNLGTGELTIQWGSDQATITLEDIIREINAENRRN